MIALTIAGFDPSSGAGVTADLQTFAAHGIFGTSIITALTAQSTRGVSRTESVAPGFLREAIHVLTADLPPDGIKIGMLGGPRQVEEVVSFLSNRTRVPVVLDPVLRSSSGAELLEQEGIQLLRTYLLPLVSVVTPNIRELAALSQLPCDSLGEIRTAAEALSGKAGCAVVVTGGDADVPTDYVLQNGEWTELRGVHIESKSTHGTGCAFSSALLCGLLKGSQTVDAAREAKHFVSEAILRATPLGMGKGPMNLLWPLTGEIPA